jgi:hypothetical protein
MEQERREREQDDYDRALAAAEARGAERALREAAEWVIGCEHVTAMRWCGTCDQWRARLEDEAAARAAAAGGAR